MKRDLDVPGDDPSTTPETAGGSSAPSRPGPPVAGLVVIHSPGDTAHLGAWLPVPGGLGAAPIVLGRGAEGDGARAVFVRQRPGEALPLPPLGNRALSRSQLELRHTPLGIEAVNIGRIPLAVNGVVTSSARLAPGDVVELGRQLVLLACVRPARLEGPPPDPRHAFGGPDVFGMVGESPRMWRLRGELASAAQQRGHVLVLGPSGSGKELAAAAIHGLSCRAEQPFVARNAATLPESLVDAELFGNAKGYPNPGMPERKGLIGDADGGTLFLDEVGDLPAAAQPHLLRVLDRGEYQRLGESRTRVSRFRLIAATNRPESALRHDFLARFDVRISMAPLAERREDISLLAMHLLGSTFGAVVERFRDGNGQPRLGPSFAQKLATHELAANVRELRALLLAAIQQSPGDTLLWHGAEPPLEGVVSGGDELEPAAIQAALDLNNGSIERTFRELGLPSRHVLSRLVQKHGLVLTRRR